MSKEKVGDVAVIGEFHSQLVVAHYVLAHPEKGPFVQLYRCDLGWTIDKGLQDCEPLYSPVVVGIGAAVSSGRWKVLGNIAPGRFKWPKYLMHGGKESWWVYDGRKEKRLGAKVPQGLQSKEVLCVWSAVLLEERIETGVNTFGYEARMKWSR